VTDSAGNAGTLTIRVSTEGSGPVFELAAGEAEVRAAQIVIVEEGKSVPAWWLVAAAQQPPVTLKEAKAVKDVAAVKQLAELVQARMASRAANQPVSRLTYGIVPPGFRQAMPGQGAPARLRTGVRHRISVVGSPSGQHDFIA
jgi:hypothetical protein